MNLKTIHQNEKKIAVVDSHEALMTDVQSALDLMVTVSYESGSNRIAINKAAISEDFFDLKTRLAGDILQKFINYHTKLAVFGDFSVYTRKSLKDFICESNNGRDIFFVATEEQAVERLSRV